MAKKKPSGYQRFMALTDEEKDVEVAAYDRELPTNRDGLPGRPLTARQQSEWKKIQRRLQRGRPKVGRGVKRVMISVEVGLLHRADGFAKKHQMKRSELVAKALESVIAKAS